MKPGDLRVEVEDENIVVTMLGTSFRTSFFKSANEPSLVESPVMSVEKGAPSDKRRAFEALAWEVANAKARAGSD